MTIRKPGTLSFRAAAVVVTLAAASLWIFRLKAEATGVTLRSGGFRL
jgi:hypothetical protein